MTSTPPDEAVCPSCGRPSGDGCGCVDPALLIGFLDQFRSGVGGVVASDGERTEPGVDRLPVWAPDEAGGPDDGYAPDEAYGTGEWYPPAAGYPAATTPASWPPPGPAGWPPGSVGGHRSPAGGPGPGGWPPVGVRPRSRRGTVFGAVTGAVVAALAALAALAPGLAPNGVPPLPSILAAAPGPGFNSVPSSPLQGYVSSDQLRQLDGGRSLPPGGRMYATTWADTAGNALVEVAVSTPRAVDATAFAAGLYNFLRQGGGRPFSIPGLSGQAGGVATGPLQRASGHTQVAAVTARSRVSLLFLAGGPDPVRAQSTVTRLAQTVGASIPLDGGTLGAAPNDTVAPVAFVAAEVFGAALLGAVVGVVVVALVRRSRAAF